MFCIIGKIRRTVGRNSLSLLLAVLCFASVASSEGAEISDSQTILQLEKIAAIPDSQRSFELMLLPAMQSWAQALKENPGSFKLHYLLARAYEKMGLEELAQAEILASEAAGTPFREFILACLRKYVLASDFISAMSYYQLAKKYFPDDAAVSITGAILLHSQGNFAEEEELLQAVLKRGKQDLGIATALASVRVVQGRYEEALKLFDRELLLSPDYQPALLGKAKTLERMARYGDCLKIAIPLYLEDTFRPELAQLVASSFSHLGLYRDALQPALVSLAVTADAEQLKQAKRLVVFIWSRLSPNVCRQQLAEVTRVLDKTVYGPRLYFALGDALQNSGFEPEAELQFRTGLKLDRFHARAYLHLAEIYQNYYHNRERAIFNYLRYLHYAGNDNEIQARLARLSAETQRRKDVALRLKRRLQQGAFLTLPRSQALSKNGPDLQGSRSN